MRRISSLRRNHPATAPIILALQRRAAAGGPPLGRPTSTRLSYGDDPQKAFGVMAKERQRVAARVESTSTRYTVEKIDESKAPKDSFFVGIDLGTTNSCISYIDPETRKPRIVPSPTGSWVFPTAVAFDKNHTVRLCGEEARAAARASASATLCSGKRLIGRSYGELQRVSGQMSKTNNLSINERGEVTLEVGSKQYTIVHITAMFLRYMKQCAEEYLKRPVDRAVVSVPAFFSPQQKVATEDAALIAGFDVLEVIDEPTAACLSYSALHPPIDSAQKQSNIVFDLGGGTLDCAIMDHDVAANTFTLVGTHGDAILGGNDWDNVIVHEIVARFKKKWKIDLDNPIGTHIAASTSDHRVLQLEAEKCKIHFSHSGEDYHGFVRGFHFSEAACELVPLEVDFTKEEYEKLTEPLRQRCLVVLERLFEEVRRSPSSIENILLVGAMTRDPPIREMLAKFFGREPTASDACAADYAVAIGAAVRGGMLCGMFPHLNENTQFVTGTMQARRTGSVMQNFMDRVSTAFSSRSVNPNAIGHKWRGRANGLKTEEIEHYAKELVEFEAACSRRLLLDKCETDANNAMQRVARHSTKRHGVTEKKVNQLVEQLKFWQYMVHNYHDHEEHLLKCAAELNGYMDDLDGVDRTPPKQSERVADDGTIRFDSAPAEAGTSATAAGSRNGVETGTANGEGVANGTEESPTTRAVKRKVIRRDVPVPPSAIVEGIVEKGAPSLTVERWDFTMSEKTRQEFFENYVEERAYRDVPAPPGERGSWQEVRAAMSRGEPVGRPVPLEEAGEVRPMSMDEQLAELQDRFPLQPEEMTSEQRRLYALGTALSSMTVLAVLPAVKTLNDGAAPPGGVAGRED